MNLKAWRKNLQHHFVQINNIKISIYKNIQKNKPTAVLLHGFGGNYFGLTPLGYELSKKYSIIICDLPAHGKSSLHSFSSIDTYHSFYQDLISELKKINEIGLVVAHSFGCYLASDPKISNQIPTVLLNPVYDPSRSFLFGMKSSYSSSPLMILSNIPIFSPIKAVTLQKTWSLEASKNIYQNIFACQNSIKKLLAQKKTIPIALNNNAFKNKNNVKLVIIADNDTTVKPFQEKSFRTFFPSADFKIIEKSGHLLPMEKPREIAKIIFENIQ